MQRPSLIFSWGIKQDNSSFHLQTVPQVNEDFPPNPFETARLSPPPPEQILYLPNSARVDSSLFRCKPSPPLPSPTSPKAVTSASKVETPLVISGQTLLPCRSLPPALICVADSYRRAPHPFPRWTLHPPSFPPNSFLPLGHPPTHILYRVDCLPFSESALLCLRSPHADASPPPPLLLFISQPTSGSGHSFTFTRTLLHLP